jgi:hypothetical protein
MNPGGQAPPGAAMDAEGSMSAVAAPAPDDSQSRLPVVMQHSQATEDDEDEVVEQDLTGGSVLGALQDANNVWLPVAVVLQHGAGGTARCRVPASAREGPAAGIAAYMPHALLSACNL